MLRGILLTFALACCLGMSSLVSAQTTGDRIDLYFADWHTAAPRGVRGSLQERDILTRGDAIDPRQKGGVLRYLNSYTYATLPPHSATRATRLEAQQEIYFIESGRGTATAKEPTKERTIDVHRNIAILMPANLEFTITNTGEETLAMYVINEPTPPGFRPNLGMLVRDESQIPISSSGGLWTNIVKTLFVTADGLATLQSVLTVRFDPLTIGKPHPVPGEDTSEIEEVWTALDGTSLAFVGNQLRPQTPGMAFYHIPDNQTPHTHINQSEDEPVRFLYFARYRAHPFRP